MDHGKALSLEMLSFAKVTELSDKHVEEDEPYNEIEPDLLEAEKIAKEFGDVNLYNRILEIRANIYLRIGRHDKEVECIEKACALLRTVPKMMVLLDAHSRLIDSLYTSSKPDTDLLLKYNARYWETYLWLRDEGRFSGFSRERFVEDKKRANQLFKVAIYIGSFAGSPLHGGQENENFKMGLEAFDEAIWVAEFLDNKEFLCAASAHRAAITFHKLNPEEKRLLIENLKRMQQTYEPDNSELHDLIDSLTKLPGFAS